MNKIKRQLSSDISSIEKTKKLRTGNPINCVENLSNELFFEIFDYLDGCSLYEAFSNLNTRFQHLLNHSSLRLKIILTSDSKSILEHYSKDCFISNKHQIISFRFNNTIDRFPLLSWFPVDSTFIRLESLTLMDIQSDEFVSLVFDLVCVPCLLSLTVSFKQNSVDLGFIYQLIFNLPKLKYNKLSCNVSNTNVSSLKTYPSQLSSIEYLVIDHPCTLNDLITILSYTSRLSHLKCKRSLSKSNFSIQQIQSMTLFNLTHIYMNLTLVRFDEFEIFIKSISSQLRVLKLNAYGDATYLNADRWEKLILEHIPYLWKFKFAYVEVKNEHSMVTPYHERINRFNSAFWTQKQWYFGLDIKATKTQNCAFVYYVYPRSLRHAEFDGYPVNSRCFTNNNGQNFIQQAFSIPSITYNPVFILNLLFMNSNTTYLDIIRPILRQSPINALNVSCGEISIGKLAELIRSLPNLDSLIVRSLIMIQVQCLSSDEKAALRCVSKNNKITKVIMKKMTNMAQLYFLIRACPRMQHLEVAGSNYVNAELLLRFIFKENAKRIPDLSLLYFNISKAHGETIESIQQMIDREKLCRDYTIEWRNNGIYLQWNKQ